MTGSINRYMGVLAYVWILRGYNSHVGPDWMMIQGNFPSLDYTNIKDQFSAQ
jgi:hypothetical protein